MTVLLTIGATCLGLIVLLFIASAVSRALRDIHHFQNDKGDQ